MEAKRATTDKLDSSETMVLVISGGGTDGEGVPTDTSLPPPPIWGKEAQPNCPNIRRTNDMYASFGEVCTAPFACGASPTILEDERINSVAHPPATVGRFTILPMIVSAPSSSTWIVLAITAEPSLLAPIIQAAFSLLS